MILSSDECFVCSYLCTANMLTKCCVAVNVAVPTLEMLRIYYSSGK